jgi:hypothetical protein
LSGVRHEHVSPGEYSIATPPSRSKWPDLVGMLIKGIFG